MIEWLPWLPSKSCYTNLKFFETLKDTPNPSKGFRFVAFLVLEILGGSFSTLPPWCLVWVPKPLVPGGLNHFTKTRPIIESHLEDLLKTMKGFKFIETLEATFEKDTIDSKTGKPVSIYKIAFFNGKAKTITKVDDIEPKLNMSRQEILNMIDKWVSEGSGWVIDRIDSHYINFTLYKPLNGSSYIELPMELRNSKKGLINMKNEDEECFRWCHIRHLNP